MKPCKELFARFRYWRNERFHIKGDTVPAKSCPSRFKAVTLWCLRPQVTPVHWQKWWESFQEANVPAELSVKRDLNCCRAILSVSFPRALQEAKLVITSSRIKMAGKLTEQKWLKLIFWFASVREEMLG